MYSLEYLPIARRDMVDIAKYIGIKLANPDAADRLAEEMIEAAESLINMPYKCPMYTPVKPLKHEYRKLIVHNYIIKSEQYQAHYINNLIFIRAFIGF